MDFIKKEPFKSSASVSWCLKTMMAGICYGFFLELINFSIIAVIVFYIIYICHTNGINLDLNLNLAPDFMLIIGIIVGLSVTISFIILFIIPDFPPHYFLRKIKHKLLPVLINDDNSYFVEIQLQPFLRNRTKFEYFLEDACDFGFLSIKNEQIVFDGELCKLVFKHDEIFKTEYKRQKITSRAPFAKHVFIFPKDAAKINQIRIKSVNELTRFGMTKSCQSIYKSLKKYQPS